MYGLHDSKLLHLCYFFLSSVPALSWFSICYLNTFLCIVLNLILVWKILQYIRAQIYESVTQHQFPYCCFFFISLSQAFSGTVIEKDPMPSAVPHLTISPPALPTILERKQEEVAPDVAPPQQAPKRVSKFKAARLQQKWLLRGKYSAFTWTSFVKPLFLSGNWTKTNHMLISLHAFHPLISVSVCEVEHLTNQPLRNTAFLRFIAASFASLL